MNLQTLTTVVTKLIELELAKNTYIDSIPTDIRGVFFDNEYTNSMGRQYDLLLQTLFGPAMAEDVYWFLLEWKPGYTVSIDGKEYVINTPKEFIAYMAETYALE